MKEQKQDAIVQALDERLAIARTYQFKTLIENLAAARAQLAAERAAAEGMREGIAYNRPPEILVTLAEVYRAARHEAH